MYYRLVLTLCSISSKQKFKLAIAVLLMFPVVYGLIAIIILFKVSNPNSIQTTISIIGSFMSMVVVVISIVVGYYFNTRYPDINTAFLIASSNGDVDKVSQLHKQGADVNVMDEENQTSLMLASQKGYVEIVDGLLNRCADAEAKDNKGRTPLMHAVKGRSIDIVKMLLKEDRTDINAKNNKDKTALDYAKGNKEIIELLKETIKE